MSRTYFESKMHENLRAAQKFERYDVGRATMHYAAVAAYKAMFDITPTTINDEMNRFQNLHRVPQWDENGE